MCCREERGKDWFFGGFWYLEQRCEGRTGRVADTRAGKGDGGGTLFAVMAVVSLGYTELPFLG